MAITGRRGWLVRCGAKTFLFRPVAVSTGRSGPRGRRSTSSSPRSRFVLRAGGFDDRNAYHAHHLGRDGGDHGQHAGGFDLANGHDHLGARRDRTTAPTTPESGAQEAAVSACEANYLSIETALTEYRSLNGSPPAPEPRGRRRPRTAGLPASLAGECDVLLHLLERSELSVVPVRGAASHGSTARALPRRVLRGLTRRSQPSRHEVLRHRVMADDRVGRLLGVQLEAL